MEQNFEIIRQCALLKQLWIEQKKQEIVKTFKGEKERKKPLPNLLFMFCVEFVWKSFHFPVTSFVRQKRENPKTCLKHTFSESDKKEKQWKQKSFVTFFAVRISF